MTTKAAFTEEEWDLLRAGPPAAGMLVIASSGGGMMRETFELAKVYADARAQHGAGELLDELVASKPEKDHTRSHSIEELRERTLQRLGEAVALLRSKGTPEDLDGYRGFIRTLTVRVAQRHKEDGVDISPGEQQAIDDVAAALGG